MDVDKELHDKTVFVRESTVVYIIEWILVIKVKLI